jgi:hypothetical protein
MVDITQIIEQVLPFFTPELYIRLSIPELKIEGLAEDGEPGSDKLDLKVIYEGSTTDIPLELDEVGFRMLKWTLNFKVQGYLFSPIFNAKAVHNVVSDTYDYDNQSEAAEDIADGQLITQVGRTMYQGVTTATAIPTIGGPTAITIHNAGTGYSLGTALATTSNNGTGLTIDVSSVGTGANAGKITGVSINDAGTNYLVNDVVAITGTTATVTVTTINATTGAVTGLTITNQGTAYVAGQNTSTFGGNGAGLKINITGVNVTTGAITGVVIHTAGTGYEATNIVSVVDGNEDALIQITTVITDQIDDSIRAMYKYEHYE